MENSINAFILNDIKSRKHYKEISSESEIIKNCFESCIHILQDEYGSGVCISSKGHILTCYHCVPSKKKIKIIFPNGIIFNANKIKSSKKLDIALLKIVSQEENIIDSNNNIKNEAKILDTNNAVDNYLPEFPFSPVSENLEEKNSDLFCIGNPYCYDLESKRNKKKTYFHPFYLSKGKVIDYEEDFIYGNIKKELGPLHHDCWTYWGHSGAPLFNNKGVVVGLHNSWNEENGMRHGLSAASINKFLNEIKDYMS